MGLRYFKLFILVATPVLGFLYAYQFTGQTREVIVPFHSFKAPSDLVSPPAQAEVKVAIPLKSAITVVNFWATWCPPCVEEFPAMIELQRQMKGKGTDIVFVSIDEKWEDVAKFFKNNNVTLDPERMFWDPKRTVAASWGSEKFPETYVVRKDSWVVEKIIGVQQWTRPVVIKYFTDLGEKFKDLGPTNSALLDWLAPAAFAQSKDGKNAGFNPEPMIHEDDKKALETLRKNIEVATQNLQKTEAALKEENRNLSEQKMVFERRKKDQSESEADHDKLQAKVKESRAVLEKTKESMKTEDREKKRIESQVKETQIKITELQKQLEGAKDQLTQTNKNLNTRVSNIETLQKAQENSEDELKALLDKDGRAKSVVEEKRKSTAEAKNEIFSRERKVEDIKKQSSAAEYTLKEQKKKLEEFEKLLKR